MYTTVFIYITSYVFFSQTVTVYRHSVGNDIVAKIRTEIPSFVVQCYMSDIVIISAPIINRNDTLYYLRKPNGDDLKLELGPPRQKRKYRTGISTRNDSYGNVLVRFLGHKYKVISPIYKYKTFNVNYGVKETYPEDIFVENLRIMKDNDFIIGPVDYDDHGNWMLSAYYRDEDEWGEVYQIITIQITESVPAEPAHLTLKPGDDLELRFAYPVKDLESCQLNVPRASVDKVYDRRWAVPDTCGYVVRNVTTQERGVWRIIGVGKVVYTSMTLLTVESGDEIH